MEPTDSRAPASLVVLAATLVVSAAEYLAWVGSGELNELAPVALMTLAVAALAAGVAAVTARLGSRLAGLLVGLALAWTLFASAVDIVRSFALAALLVATAGLLVRARTTVVATITLCAVAATALHYYGSLRPSSPTVAERNLPDIVLLVMDTTRRDRLSLYGYPKATTPNLEAFAERAQVYEDAWSVAPWTSPSHASMFTGLLPGEHGVDGALAMSFPKAVPTLPETLSEAGYRTAGFPGNANLFARGWDRGFDVYLPAEYQKNHALIRTLNRLSRRWRDPAEHALGDRLLARARRWWDANAGAPRFVFVNLIEPHSPYIPTDEFFHAFLPGISRDEALAVQARMRPDGSASPAWTERERRILGHLYDAEIADLDRRIGGFLDWLDVRGELDDTLVVITSDHGERLGERGLVGHSLVMDPYLLRVPLVVSYPARLEPARIAERVQLDGVAGYVLELAGLTPPETMRPLEARDAAVAQYRPPASIVDDMLDVDPEFDVERYRRDWSFITRGRFGLTWSSPDAVVLTELDEDPEFLQNAAAEYPEETEALLAIAKELPTVTSRGRPGIDPSLEDSLRSLGYLP